MLHLCCHDNTGLITEKTKDGAETAYTYDAARRLISANSDSYNYDAAGNNQNNNVTYAANNNRLLFTDIRRAT